MDPSVWLRPVTEADLDLIELLYEDPDEAGVYGFYGYLNPGVLRRGFAEGGLISDRNGRLSVGPATRARPGTWPARSAGTRSLRDRPQPAGTSASGC